MILWYKGGEAYRDPANRFVAQPGDQVEFETGEGQALRDGSPDEWEEVIPGGTSRSRRNRNATNDSGGSGVR